MTIWIIAKIHKVIKEQVITLLLSPFTILDKVKWIDRENHIFVWVTNDMKIKDLQFKKFITAEKIEKRVIRLAEAINADYDSKTPLFLPILNGSFIFASDLMKHITLACRVSFVKHSSYQGTVSSGQSKTLIGLQESIFGQELILVEDVMDTGFTLTKVVEELKSLGVKSVEIVTLLRKARAREQAVQPRFVGFEIEDEFVLGYGLDYDGLGRNLKDIYKSVNPPTPPLQVQ